VPTRAVTRSSPFPPMPALRELQSRMRDALVGGDPVAAERHIQSDGIAPHARLAIYRHHVTTTLTDVLADVFPVVRRLVDPRFFSYTADRYLRAEPPASPCLFEYGATFPDFLAAFESCRDLAYLADVGRLEWAMHVASHAADAPLADADRLAAMPSTCAARVRLRLDPGVTLLRSRWPVDEIWRAHRYDAEPAVTRLVPGDVRLEVRREGEDVVMRRLPRGVFAFRRALAVGSRLRDAAADGLASDPAFDLAASLVALFGDAIVVAVSIEANEGGE
jgi:hypothetical protein